MKKTGRNNIKIACDLSLALILLLLFLTYTNYALGAQTNPTIRGNITNIPTGSRNLVHLYSWSGGKLLEEASAPVNEHGDFRFEIKDKLQRQLYKIGLDQTNAASIVLSGEKEISIKADYGELKADRIAATNSRENEAYRALLDEWKRLSEKITDLSFENSRISVVDPFYVQKTKGIENRMRLVIQGHNVDLLYAKERYQGTFMSEVLVNLSLLPQLSDHPDLKDSYDNKRAFMHDYFFEYIDFADERIIYTPFLHKKYFTYLDKYTHHSQDGFKDSVSVMLTIAEANSAVWEFTLEYLINTFNNKGLSKLADYVVDTYVEGCSRPLSRSTMRNIETLKRLRAGQIAPEIISKDTDGKTVALSTQIGKDTLMVYFWASWCDGCEAENPNIVSLYNKFKDNGLDVYAVSLDKNKDEWLKAIERHKFTWTNVSDLNKWESEAAKAYNVNATPTIYLLDKEGRIIAKNLRGRELEMKVEKLLK